jgi:hypothetical protein
LEVTVKEFILIQFRFGHGADEFPDADGTITEQGFDTGQALGTHNVVIAQYLTVDGANYYFCIVTRPIGT